MKDKITGNDIFIVVDSREKPRATAKILKSFELSGIKYISSKLPYGDYMSYDNPRLVIDRKQNLAEICKNVVQDHKRFIAEIEGAYSHGIKLVFLIEHSRNVTCLEDVAFWKNPRLRESPMAVSGERLYKILSCLRDKYGVQFVFCDKFRTGKVIAGILAARSTEEYV